MKVEERFNIEKVKLPPSCLHLFFTRDFCFSYLASQDSCPLKGKGEQEERRGHWKFSHPIRQGGKTLPNWFAIDASSLFSCLLPIHSSFLSFDTMRLCILDDKIRRGTKTHTGLLCSSAAKSHLSRHGKKKSERLPLLLSTYVVFPGWTAGLGKKEHFVRIHPVLYINSTFYILGLTFKLSDILLLNWKVAWRIMDSFRQ